MRKWFTVPSLLQLILSIGLISIFLLQASISSSRLILKELQRQILIQVSDQLEQRLQLANRLNQIHHDSLQYGLLDLTLQPEREKYFVNHLKAFPDAAMTYIGLIDGSFYGARRTVVGNIQVVRNNKTTDGASMYYATSESGEGIELVDQFPNFDPRKRPWYQKAEQTGEPTFSGVYSHFVFREPTITASYPVYQQGTELVGVFGVDFLLSWIGEVLRSLPIGASGHVFMTDDAGMLIATSANIPTYTTVDGVSELMSALEADNILIHTAMTLPAEETQKDLPTFRVGNDIYHLGTAAFEFYGVRWNIYVVSAENDFLGDVKKATTQTIVILAISFFISIFFATWVARRISKPIVKLSVAAEELASGKHVPIADDGRKDELGKLTRSFNKMGVQLTEMVSHLEEDVALRTKELEERNLELQRLSFLDGLTGIANRRKFDDTLLQYWQTALRHGNAIALLMLDIDFFKNYNDTYGHQAGDECLKKIATLLQSKVRRATDLAARYGGEEFVILLQDDADHLETYADGIRNSISQLEIEHTTSPFEHVTVSIGCAHLIPKLDMSHDILVEVADRLLYQAKENGRNKVCI